MRNFRQAPLELVEIGLFPQALPSSQALKSSRLSTRARTAARLAGFPMVSASQESRLLIVAMSFERARDDIVLVFTTKQARELILSGKLRSPDALYINTRYL